MQVERYTAQAGAAAKTSMAIILILGSGTLAGCNGTQEPSEPEQAESSSGPSQARVEHQRFLQEFAQEHELHDVPDVEVVRSVTPAESKEVVDECVAAQGWPQLPDGTFQYPSDQDSAFSLAMYTCLAQYPVGEAYVAPMGKDQWAAIYDYWVEETIPCLEAEGFDVPEPPSRATFVDSPTWTPDSTEVRDQVAARVAAGSLPSHEYVFTDVCPVTPPDGVVFRDSPQDNLP